MTARGSELAATGRPALDDLDQEVLAALAVTSMGVMKLSRRIEVCPMTVKRRARLLVERGLVFADPRRFFGITAAGRAALGDTDTPRHAPWFNPAAISAVAAKDVRPAADASQRRSIGRVQKPGRQDGRGPVEMETQRLRKTGSERFAPGEFDHGGRRRA